ncbi:MAG: 2Fe-2S iron-sulfur cluster-binding protein, partial [Candidatus Thermoplasmatota archaeon]|nr:2Fe-2S iron-sulfur cluster-binding protein [Candidatus Thermoplasmatota archaeon]
MRLSEHPILEMQERKKISFAFDGKDMEALEGEVISSALFANGIRIFNWHHVDGSPQGIFCANGQCAQCLVLADGVPVKACITEIREGMDVRAIRGLPELPEDEAPVEHVPTAEVEVDVLIVGGGPAGLSAAKELGKNGVGVIIADDKLELGGKLSLQTHNFFGSIKDCYAGTRGMDIGKKLAGEINAMEEVEVWLNSPVVGVFTDKKVGVVKDGAYTIVSPKVLLVTAGAREKSLAFPGCDLPGVYGAGAFQTLVNRDMVAASKRIFVLGGGNVGLIAAYHALQAGIEVAGLAEGMVFCGGYKVHLDKLRRFGIPIYTSHTVVRAVGGDGVEKVVIAEVDESFNPISGTEKEFSADTLLIAVGLNPVNEIAKQAKEFGFSVYSAGDADLISEASAAMFSGKIVGSRIMKDMGLDVAIPDEWDELMETLRSCPAPVEGCETASFDNGVYPVIRCNQEIPCNPCTEVCPKNSIKTMDGTVTGLPVYDGECISCGRCVCICPGLAITLVDKDYDPARASARVVIPWELPEGTISDGEEVITSGFEGEVVGRGKVLSIKGAKWQDRRKLVHLQVPFEDADEVAGIRMVQSPPPKSAEAGPCPEDDIII